MTDKVLLQVNDLTKFYPIQQGLSRRAAGTVHAVDSVSFEVKQGECLGLVGESGCGKTTVARCILKLIEPTSGQITLHAPQTDLEITTADGKEVRQLRRWLQMIFQDPFASLDPRWTVGNIIAEPLIAQGISRREAEQRVAEVLPLAGLGTHFSNRYPHELSGGERQRVGIARAIVVNPLLIVADEPVSALDVSVRAQIVNLLLELQERLGLSYIFIAHDLSIVKHISDRIGVMYLGQIVEIGSRDQVFTQLMHPYTEALLMSVLTPVPDERGISYVLEGDVPSPINPPTGCRFASRCRFAQAQCREQSPDLRDMGGGHLVRCHFAGELELIRAN
ncbi:MAG: oligopeptide/dipeptide ABC transporter ATP-binding protein [Anaerolineae bacterium]|nr:ATP-binding cassette domain-containing protein [Anaerolineae bacterium]